MSRSIPDSVVMTKMMDLREIVQFPAFQKLHIADQLLCLLLNKGTRLSSASNDHIYGILGLVEMSALPDNLLPDYTKEFELVSKDYIMYILEHTGNITLIDLCQHDKLQNEKHGQQSWIPDFRYLPSGATRLALNPPTRNAIIWQGNGDSMSVEGTRVGTVLEFSRCSDDEYWGMISLHKSTLEAAASLRQESRTQVFKEFLRPFEEATAYSASYQSMEELVSVLRMVMRQISPTENTTMEGREVNGEERLFLLNVANTFINGAFALLEDG